MEREPFEPLEGTLDGRPVQADALAEFRERRLGRLPPRLGDETDRVGLLGEATIALKELDGCQLTGSRGNGTLEVGCHGVDDPVQLATERPRDLPRLELEKRASRSGQPEEVDDGVG